MSCIEEHLTPKEAMDVRGFLTWAFFDWDERSFGHSNFESRWKKYELAKKQFSLVSVPKIIPPLKTSIKARRKSTRGMEKFEVCLGRLVRETATVVVEAKSRRDLESRLSEVYEAYDGDWDPDTEWGCQESDSHAVLGEAKKGAEIQVSLIPPVRRKKNAV
jgi:hypothetical protein